MKVEMSLNDWLFVAEYVKDWNATKALKRSGIYSGDYPNSEAARRLAKPAVAAEIAKMRDEIVGKVQLSTSMVAQDIMAVLTADPRELYEIIVIACRYCHGHQHQYQRTLNEYRRDEFQANAKGKEFDPQGGIGYNPHKGPHDDCPECFGKGETIERMKDVRFLSPAAAALYMGGKRGKHGLEIQMRSKDAARAAAALYLGMNKETLKLNTAKAPEMTDEELAAFIAQESKK